ncbi:hypothetical protein B0E38_06475 [Streptomyces sp. 111WW2]|uniref:hypothetical protein n=1 Tax=Streptomyces sp. 111WW2 TaxID=1945515 RepID=UPI000D0C80A1|nr:hypothetical protein [Streptomyces sp. 111WW2]PSK47998.1 hypothetical protein B0E38_06475 [Streptomyces sp. 111WW2]
MSTCTICGHGLSDVRALRTTCEACQDRILSGLTAIEEYWPQLSDALEPSRGHSGPRVSGSPVQSLPAEQVLNLIGPGGISTRLYERYADLALARGLQPAARPASTDVRLGVALRGIRRHLSWAVQGVDLRPLADEIRTAVGELRAATGHTERAITVPCPGPADGQPCDGLLRYDRDRNTAYCRTCRTELEAAAWLEYSLKTGHLTV